VSTVNKQRYVEVSTDVIAPSLGLTLLLVGLFYAFPLPVFPLAHPFLPSMGKGILNLYCLTAWMGLAHFVYAYWGQFKSLNSSKRSLWLLFLLMVTLLLFGVREYVGYRWFSVLTWVYFFPHFIKAELLFNAVFNQQIQATVQDFGCLKPWQVYWFPTVAFAYFSVMLFYPTQWGDASVVLWCVGILLLGLAFVLGVFKQLHMKPFAAYALLGCFFVGETFAWGTYRPYMDNHFQQGLYLFHVGIASLYHYFRSYHFARGYATPFIVQGKAWVSLPMIIGINVVCIGFATILLPLGSNASVGELIVAPQFFTVWVALHLFASDSFLQFRKATVLT
jgi:hypothetical protein